MANNEETAGSPEQAQENKNIDTADKAQQEVTDTPPQEDDSTDETATTKEPGKPKDESTDKPEAEHHADKQVTDTPDQSKNETNHPEAGSEKNAEVKTDEKPASTPPKSETLQTDVSPLEENLEKSREIDGDHERESLPEK